MVPEYEDSEEYLKNRPAGSSDYADKTAQMSRAGDIKIADQGKMKPAGSAFQGLAPFGEERKGRVPDHLALAIMKEEAERAGTRYIWHPKFREYARTPGNHPLDYEAFYNDPKNKADREEQARLLEPFSRPERLEKLLIRHPDKKERWGHLNPELHLSEGELIARDNYLLKASASKSADEDEGQKYYDALRDGYRRAKRNPSSTAAHAKLVQNTHSAGESESDAVGFLHHSFSEKELQRAFRDPYEYLQTMLNTEGGYNNEASDRGGETFRGVSRRIWPNWPGWQMVDEVKAEGKISAQEIDDHFQDNPEMQKLVEDLYLREYWEPFADLPASEDIIFKLFGGY